MFRRSWFPYNVMYKDLLLTWQYHKTSMNPALTWSVRVPNVVRKSVLDWILGPADAEVAVPRPPGQCFFFNVLRKKFGFFFTYLGAGEFGIRKKTKILRIWGLASLKYVKKPNVYVFQLSKIWEMSEIRAKIKGKFVKVSKTKQNFRLRRAKRAKKQLKYQYFHIFMGKC